MAKDVISSPWTQECFIFFFHRDIEIFDFESSSAINIAKNVGLLYTSVHICLGYLFIIAYMCMEIKKNHNEL